MADLIYVETEVAFHPRTLAIIKRYKNAHVVEIKHYGEVFNPKAQNFRLQKIKPALIIAKKHNSYVLPAPPNYGIGSNLNYYFSHMLNCIYDCRYCFLQGMYQSANLVLFVNFEDFFSAIKTISMQNPKKAIWYFSGYDCDSLAYEPMTQFCHDTIEALRDIPNAFLELRTKSTQIRGLLKLPVHKNTIVAFSFTEQESHQQLEKGVPSIQKRIDAIKTLSEKGWKIGLRFDPIIYHAHYQQQFSDLLRQIFSQVEASSVHSVSLGVFRLPKQIYKKIHKLYPQEKLLNQSFELENNLYTYPQNREQEMLDYCTQALLKFISEEQLFPCS